MSGELNAPIRRSHCLWRLPALHSWHLCRTGRDRRLGGGVPSAWNGGPTFERTCEDSDY